QRHACLSGDRGEGGFSHGLTFRLVSKVLGKFNGQRDGAVLAASYGNRCHMKTFVTTRKRGVDPHWGRTYDGGTSKVFENFRDRLAPVTHQEMTERLEQLPAAAGPHHQPQHGPAAGAGAAAGPVLLRRARHDGRRAALRAAAGGPVHIQAAAGNEQSRGERRAMSEPLMSEP